MNLGVMELNTTFNNILSISPPVVSFISGLYQETCTLLEEEEEEEVV
jgi:hypothetical protein